MFIAAIAIFGAVAALLAAVSLSHRVFTFSQEADDANLLATFIERDMKMASHFTFRAQRLWITEDDGVVNSYWMDAQSTDIDRAVNGRGVIVVSTHVDSVTFSVLPEGGLETDVSYLYEGVSYMEQLQVDFGEGTLG